MQPSAPPIKTNYLVIFSLLFGYLLLSLMRKSFSFVIVYVLQENSLKATDVGMIISCQTIGYTLGKFVSGILVDQLNSTLLLVAAMFLSSIAVFLFSLCSNYYLYLLIWSLSGVILGVGWPCIAKILRRSVPPTEFATWWSILSCSINLAGFCGPIIAMHVSNASHWKHNLQLISFIGFLYSFILAYIILDLKKERKNVVKVSTTTKQPAVNTEAVQNLGLLGAVTHPLILCNSAIFFSVSIVRFSVADWMPIYLTTELGMSRGTAVAFVSMVETGGLLGNLSVGYISDSLISRFEKYGNPRVPVIFFCTIGNIVCILIISFLMTPHWHQTFISTLAFVMGLMTFGPIALCGVIALESVPDGISGSVHAFTALIANIGGICAGYPLSKLANYSSWWFAFLIQALAMGVAAVSIFTARYCKFETAKELVRTKTD